ncbi:MAG TPA: hypothetical protein PLS81_06225 [Deltaproteobacteria bacterium]|nr:hypothetical protein [Deltaproteobacteria bacterium]HPP80676.1 hypothetical protein [Deltaproteobacteria bacterium]
MHRTSASEKGTVSPATLRVLSVRLLVILALLPMAAISCSSDGGGGGGDGSSAVPDELSFSMDLSSDFVDPLTITSYTDSNKSITIASVSGPVSGTYNHATGEYTITEGALVNVRYSLWDEPYRTFTIYLASDVTGSTGQTPLSGALEVRSGTDTVTVTISPSGVRLSLDGADPTSTIAWQDLYPMYYDEDEPGWRKEASLACVVLKFLVEEIAFSADTLVTIALNEETLETAGYLEFEGDPLPPSIAFGESTSVLRLTSPSIRDGATFQWLYDWCWDDDPSSSEDLLYDGTVQMSGYTETVDVSGSTRRFTELGFGSGTAPGGVSYDRFMIYVTEETSGSYTIPEARTLVYDGGYSILFTSGD